MWLGRTIWPKSEDGLALASKTKMDHLYEVRDLIQTHSQLIRAIVVERHRPLSSSSNTPVSSPTSASASSSSSTAMAASAVPEASSCGSPPAHSGLNGSSHVSNRLYSMLRVLKPRREQSNQQQQVADEWVSCLREAVQLHQRIEHHPLIARINQVYEDEEELCVISDHHVRGTRLYDAVRRRGRFNESAVLPLVKQLLYIAACLESNGLSLAIRPDTVFVEDSVDATSPTGDSGYSSWSLCLPDLFLIIARNLAQDRRIQYENDLSFDMSPPVGFFPPEVLESKRTQSDSIAEAPCSDSSAATEPTESSTTNTQILDPVKIDMWQVGAIVYLLLSGDTSEPPPFSHSSNTEEYEDETDIDGRFVTSPRPSFTEWLDISESGKNFLQSVLATDPSKRPTPRQALRHPWICGGEVTMLEDICIDAIVDHVAVLSDYAERLPKFLVKKVTNNTVNYKGFIPRRHQAGADSRRSAEIDAIASLTDSDSTSLSAGNVGVEQAKPFRLTDLVAELVLNVLSFLSPADLLRMGQVCQQLYELSSDNSLWKRLCLEEVGSCSNIMEDQIRRITYDNIEAQATSGLLSPLHRVASAIKRRKKNKKKGKEKNGRPSDTVLLANMEKNVWKHFYLFGMSCVWNLREKHETIEFVDGDPRRARKTNPELWCTVLGNKVMKRGVHSWTISIVHAKSIGDIMFGICKSNFNPSACASYVSDKAWLYHINQCNVYHAGTCIPLTGGSIPSGTDVQCVTCTLNLDEGTLAISVNDHDLGVIVRHLEGEFRPAVDIYNAGDTVILQSFSSAFTTRTAKSKEKDKDNPSTKGKEPTHEESPSKRIDMSLSGQSINNGLPSVCVTKKFWNSRKTVYFMSSLKQTVFHPGSQIDIAVTIDNRSSKTIRCLIISFRGLKGKKAFQMGYSHTSFSSSEGTISFPIEGRKKVEGTFTFRLPSNVGSKMDSHELHLELPIRGHSSIRAVLPILNIQGYRSSSSASTSTSTSSSSSSTAYLHNSAC